MQQRSKGTAKVQNRVCGGSARLKLTMLKGGDEVKESRSEWERVRDENGNDNDGEGAMDTRIKTVCQSCVCPEDDR